MSKGDGNKAKGDSYMAEGEKALNKQSFSFFGIGGSSTQKYEDAGELFVKAGNAYKLHNLHESAGNAFLRAADAYGRADAGTEAVNHLVEAANNFKKIHPKKAIEVYQQAIEKFNDAGRFGMSARYYKEIAEIAEADGNKSAAAAAYEAAAGMFERDNKKSNASTCMLKVAQFAAEEGNAARAAGIYESNGKEGLSSRLGAFGAKAHLTMALLCYLALGDAVQVTNKLDEYKSLDVSFPASRECQFIEKLVQAGEDMNIEDFSEACADFDRITPLDALKTSLLLRAKEHIVDASGGEVDLT